MIGRSQVIWGLGRLGSRRDLERAWRSGAKISDSWIQGWVVLDMVQCRDKGTQDKAKRSASHFWDGVEHVHIDEQICSLSCRIMKGRRPN